MIIRAKKKIALLVALMTMLVFAVGVKPISSRAADVSIIISVSAQSVKVGDSLSVTVSVSGSSLAGYTMYVGYNASVLQYNSCSGSTIGNGGGGKVIVTGNGSSSTTINFTAIAEGTAGISTSGTEFYNLESETLSSSHASVNITVASRSQNAATETPNTSTTEDKTTEDKTTEDNKKSDNSNLIAIGVSPGELDKEFRYDITEYTVKVSRDTTSITVTPEKEDSTAKYTIEGADDLKQGINEVKITVVAENGYTKVYTLQVIVGELLDDLVFTIDEKQYMLATDGAGLAVPDGFSPTTVLFGEWELPAYLSPNTMLSIVCLQEKTSKDTAGTSDGGAATDGGETSDGGAATDGGETSDGGAASDGGETSDGENAEITNVAWYIFNPENETFTLYEEFTSNQYHFVMLPLPENIALPEGYDEIELTIQNKKTIAYRSAYAGDAHMYLVYAMNVSGSEGFYIYDELEQTFMRYAPDSIPEPEVATVSDIPTPDIREQEEKGFFTKQLLAILLIVSICGMLLFAGLMIMFIIKKRRLMEELDLADSMVEQLVAANGADKVGAVNPIVQDNQAQEEQTAKTTEAEPIEEITAEQKAVLDKAKEMAADILQLQSKTSSEAAITVDAADKDTKVSSTAADKDIKAPSTAADKDTKVSSTAADKDIMVSSVEADKDTKAPSTAADKSIQASNDEDEEIKVDAVPEISLENYAETSKHIQEKIKAAYDARLDSAFADHEDL